MKKIKVNLIPFGFKNLNNRIYTKESIDFNKLKEKIDNGRLYGELGMGEMDISLSRVSHLITNIELKNNYLMGEVEILNTPNGNILNDLLNTNTIVFRPRGIGNVDENGYTILTNLITFDAIPVEEDSFKEYTNILKLRSKKILNILNNIKN